MSEKVDLKSTGDAASGPPADPWASQAGAMWALTENFAAQAVERMPWEDILRQLTMNATTKLRILDVAAGSGTASVRLAQQALTRCPPGMDVRIVASDISPGMLKELGKMVQAAGSEVSSMVEAVEEDAMKLSAADDTYDAAISVFGIPLVPDPDQACRELARVLRPGAPAVIMWWEISPLGGLLTELVVAMGGKPEDLSGMESMFQRYNSNEKLSALLQRAGLVVTHGDRVQLPFNLLAVVHQFPEMLWANPIIGQHLKNISQERAQELLVKIYEEHAIEWAEASASIVVVKKPDHIQ